MGVVLHGKLCQVMPALHTTVRGLTQRTWRGATWRTRVADRIRNHTIKAAAIRVKGKKDSGVAPLTRAWQIGRAVDIDLADVCGGLVVWKKLGVAFHCKRESAGTPFSASDLVPMLCQQVSHARGHV